MPVLIGDDPIAAVYNIIVDQGETFDRTFTWTDDAGAAISVSGGTATMKVRKLYPATFLAAAHADALVISLTQSSGITLGGAAGTINPVVSKSAIEAITPGIYNYVLGVTLAGSTTIIAQGFFEIKQGP